MGYDQVLNQMRGGDMEIETGIIIYLDINVWEGFLLHKVIPMS